MSKATAKKSRWIFEREDATYEAHKARLLAEAEGKFVVVKEDTILGPFETEQDAFDMAYERFGPGPFMVKKIAEVDEIINLL